MLFKDVLCHTRLTGVEFQRFTNRQANGIASVHGLFVLVTDCIFVIDRRVRHALDIARTGQSVHRVCVAVEFVL